MKKLLCIILAVLTVIPHGLFTVYAVDSKAVEEYPLEVVYPELIQNGAIPSGQSTSSDDGIVSADRFLTDGSGSSPEDEAYNLIFEGLMNVNEFIDISAYRFSPEKVKVLFQDLINHCPELFYTNAYSSYSAMDANSNKYVTRIAPVYMYDKDTISEMKVTYDAELKKITDLIDPEWSDLEKIVFINDYLSLNYTYDDMGLYNEGQGKGYAIYDAYGFLTQKTGVCQAYTLTAIALLKSQGIRVSSVASPPMKHIWNVVYLDGYWYHLDITWNDGYNNPTLAMDQGGNVFYLDSDNPGLVSHDFLLVSDQEIFDDQHGDLGHHDWVRDYECLSDKYDDWFWDDLYYPIVEAGDEWFTAFPQSHIIISCDIDSGETQEVTEIDLGKWYVWGSNNTFYKQAFSGIGSFEDKLYYNTSEKVYSYDPKTNVSTELPAIHDASKGRIYGFELCGDTLTYYTTIDPENGQLTSYMLTLEHDVPAVKYTVTYDINGGIGAVPVQSAVTEGSSITLAGGEGFSKDGFTFGGWKINGVTYKAGDSYTVTGNTQISAIWNEEVKHFVTYDIGDAQGIAPTQDPVKHGESIILAGDEGFSKGGFTFAGWKISGVTYHAGDSFTVNADTQITAIWDEVIKHTVTYDIGNAQGTAPIQDAVEHGNSIVLAGDEGFSKDGYTFAGWKINGVTYHEGDSFTVNADTQITAIWDEIIKHTVSYDIGDAEGIAPTQDAVTTGTVITLATADGITKTDFTFDGWRINGTVYAPGDSYTVTADTQIVAVWKAILKYSVTYYAPGADGTVPTQNAVLPGTEITLASADSISKENYTFAGWDIGGVIYQAGDEYTVNANTQIIAVWEENEPIVPSAKAKITGTVSGVNGRLSDTLVTLKTGEGIAYTAEIDHIEGAPITLVGFTFDNVESGTYDLVITKNGHIGFTVTNVVVFGDNIDFGLLLSEINLPGGDISGDNFIDSTDVAALVYDMGKSNNDAMYPDSDIDKDGFRDAKDVAILSFNMLKAEVKIDYSDIENP